MNGPTKTVGQHWTKLKASKSKSVIEKVIEEEEEVIELCRTAGRVVMYPASSSV